MEKIKTIWKYEKIVLFVFLVFSLMSVFFSSQLIKETVAAHINNVKLVEFVVDHSKFDSKILVDFVLKMVFVKDVIMALFTLVLMLFFFPTHRRILRDGVGMVKIIFLTIFFICFYLLLFGDYILMSRLQILNTALVIKYMLHFTILTSLFGTFVWFVIEYVKYRKANQIAFITHVSIRNLANKMVRHLVVCVLVFLLFVGVGVFFLSKTVQYLIAQMEIEKILGDQIQLDVTKLFLLLPDFLEKIIHIKFHPEKIGILTLDVKALGDQIQMQLTSKVQNYTMNTIVFIVKTVIFYCLIEVLNEIYRYKKYVLHYILYVLSILIAVRLLFFTSQTRLLHIIDLLLLMAILMYGATIIQWQNLYLWLSQQIQQIKQKIRKE